MKPGDKVISAEVWEAITQFLAAAEALKKVMTETKAQNKPSKKEYRTGNPILEHEKAVQKMKASMESDNDEKPVAKNPSRKTGAKAKQKEVKNAKTAEKKNASASVATGAKQEKPAAKSPARVASTTSKPAPVPTQPVPAGLMAPKVQRRLPKSVRLTPHELTLNVGSFTIKELAVNDAKEFLAHPTVFWNRSTQFPDPRRYGVQPHVEGARVIRRIDPKFVSAPYTVCLTVTVEGPDKKAEAWNVGVYTRNKAEQEG